MARGGSPQRHDSRARAGLSSGAHRWLCVDFRRGRVGRCVEAADRAREVPQSFDLALLRLVDVGRAVSLLGDVPGEWDPGEVGRYIARLVWQGLCGGRLTESQAARALWVALQEGFSPDAEFENMAYHFDDGVELAQQGIYGSLAELRTEMLDYLGRVSSQGTRSG